MRLSITEAETHQLKHSEIEVNGREGTYKTDAVILNLIRPGFVHISNYTSISIGQQLLLHRLGISDDFEHIY
jgi:hypothetical protein